MIYQVVGLVVAASALASGTVYFKEDFSSADWQKKWVEPTQWKPKVSLIELLFYYLVSVPVYVRFIAIA